MLVCVFVCASAIFNISVEIILHFQAFVFWGSPKSSPHACNPRAMMGRAGMKIGNKINYLVCALFRIGVLGLTAYFLPFCFSLTEASARCEGVVAFRVDGRACVCVWAMENDRHVYALRYSVQRG